MNEVKEIKITSEGIIAEVELMQRKIKRAGIDASLTEIVHMCIGLAKRTPKKWVVFID